MENDTNNENADSLNGTNEDLDLNLDNSLDAEAKITALEEQNKKLFERAKKAEGFTQDADGKWVKKPKPPEPVIRKQETAHEVVKPSDILRADEFKLYRQGYNESEIDLIMHNGGAKILEDKTNPLVLGLQAAKEQRGAEDAAAKAAGASGLSEIERKYTEQDLRNMKKEDLEKILPHVNY